MNSKPDGSQTRVTADKKEHSQQHRQQKAEISGGGKKQAIPSQKRASHERRQRQQIGQPQGQGPTCDGARGQPRELDTKVSQLTDKNKCCKEKISLQLDGFSKRGSEMKAEIAQALERQVGVLADQTGVSEHVDQLRCRLLELSQQPLLDVETQGPLKDEESANLDDEEARPSATQEPVDGVGDEGPEEQNKVTLVKPPTTGASESVASPPAEAQHEDDSLVASDCFEPLTARLDPKTRLVALKASLERHFVKAPELLEPICNRLLGLSSQIDVLVQQNDRNQSEIAKLTQIKTKLGDLCRELQKSNNQIRIESLGMIKSEQQKAREQAGKIQTTLAGVMKLFDENQQRNLALKQENVDLQAKLKALLDHCSQWEQCVETALKQRDIENCLLKTELKRLNLARTEEQERSLKEKQGLLRMVEIMRSHQGKIEDKEAKLREDLSSYASKYDECQEIIQKGLGKFQVESKRMLKQIEQSRHDYTALLNKYELSNKKIKELLEEKQSWMKSMVQANKKVETLERLCRSLKQENDRLASKGDSAQGAGHLQVAINDGGNSRSEPPEG